MKEKFFDFNSALAELNTHVEKVEKYHRVYGAAVEIEVGIFLYSLVRLMKPDIVIETGTSHCHSALYLAQGLSDNRKGHLYTIDHEKGETWRLDKAGLQCYYSDLIGDSIGALHQLVPKFDCCIDMAFLDSLHSYEHVRGEIEAIFPKLRKGGVIAIHDACNDCLNKLCADLIIPTLVFSTVTGVGFALAMKVGDYENPFLS
jgi:predicted O-methyltransferase YrrM